MVKRIVAYPILVLILLYLAFPYYALYSLGVALNVGNREKIERGVDFKSLKTSLKGQLNVYLTKFFSNPTAFKVMYNNVKLKFKLQDWWWKLSDMALPLPEPKDPAITPQQKKKIKPDPQVEEIQKILTTLGYSVEETTPHAWSRKIMAKITKVEFNDE